MGRILCAWWEDWPLRRPDAPPDDPCLVVDDRRVVAANRAARQAGVVVGMARREGEALCPGGVILDRDPARETLRFEPVVQIVEAIVPRVEVVAPGSLLVDITGALRYYGGEQVVVERIMERLADPGVRIGVAGGPFAARLAAGSAAPGTVHFVDDDHAFLASQDVSSIANEDLVAIFRWLGIGTLGALSSLPRHAIATRFGNDGLRAHRLASGEEGRVSARPIPPDVDVEEQYEEPLVLLEHVGFAARALAHRLIGALAAAGTAAHRIEVEATAATGERRSRVWRSKDPFTAEMLAERVWWQLRAWTESEGVPGGIIRLRLSPADVSGTGRQLGFFEDTVAEIEAERALARVQALVGHDQVLEAEPAGGREPGEQVRWRRRGEPTDLPQSEGAPWPGATPAPTPALVPPHRPSVGVRWDDGMPVQVRLRSRWVPVLNWAGPWRRTGRWWEGQPDVDRYQIVTSAGAFLCEVDGDTVRLVGVYD